MQLHAQCHSSAHERKMADSTQTATALRPSSGVGSMVANREAMMRPMTSVCTTRAAHRQGEKAFRSQNHKLEVEQSSPLQLCLDGGHALQVA